LPKSLYPLAKFKKLADSNITPKVNACSKGFGKKGFFGEILILKILKKI